jgi:hypothetical protein
MESKGYGKTFSTEGELLGTNIRSSCMGTLKMHKANESGPKHLPF